MSYRELLSGERLLETLRHSPACSQNYLDAIPEVRVRGGGAVIGEQAALDGVQVALCTMNRFWNAVFMSFRCMLWG